MNPSNDSRLVILICCFILACVVAATPQPQPPTPAPAKTWTFAVSGDSRNCGNVVMPAIAAAVKKDGASFYWHLGDYRAIYTPDEDYTAEPAHAKAAKTEDAEAYKAEYLKLAWDDFLSHQISPFAPSPVYLAPGNHETMPPKTHADFMEEFGERFFNTPELKAQRLKDDPHATTPTAYYHWIKEGVDFISLDNSLDYAYDPGQVKWLLLTIQRDEKNPDIKTIVVGMHEALPDSLSAGHSMCSSNDGIKSGREAYRALVHAQQTAHKHVYVLASHSHFFLDNIYNTPYWNDPKNSGVVLPGWVIGSAGAVRYKLPPDLPPGTKYAEHTYGYMTGIVSPDGAIAFDFHSLDESAFKSAKSADYTDSFIEQCVANNPPPDKMKWDSGDDPCQEKKP